VLIQRDTRGGVGALLHDLGNPAVVTSFDIAQGTVLHAAPDCACGCWIDVCS